MLPCFSRLFRSLGLCGLYLRAGRPWLGYIVCGLRLLALIINFLSMPNLNYFLREVQLRRYILDIAWAKLSRTRWLSFARND
jgi:hypothetical protein